MSRAGSRRRCAATRSRRRRRRRRHRTAWRRWWGQRACVFLFRLDGAKDRANDLRRAGVVGSFWGGRRWLRRHVGALVVLAAERLIDLEQHLLLPLGQRCVAEHGGLNIAVAVALVEDAGLDVERLRR